METTLSNCPNSDPAFAEELWRASLPAVPPLSPVTVPSFVARIVGDALPGCRPPKVRFDVLIDEWGELDWQYNSIHLDAFNVNPYDVIQLVAFFISRSDRRSLPYRLLHLRLVEAALGRKAAASLRQAYKDHGLETVDPWCLETVDPWSA